MVEKDAESVESEEPEAEVELSPEERAAFRDRLLDTVERMELEYDKALLVLHPLGISVTSALFVSLLNSHSVIRHREILLFAWSIWILGVIATLLSFVLSAKMHKVAAAEWRENRDPSDKLLVRRLGFWIGVTNYGSGFLFVLGIIVAAVFLMRLR